MSDETMKHREVRFPRAIKRGAVLLGLVVVALAVVFSTSACGSKKSSTSSTKAAGKCELSVFSWWTGGGEAAGLDALIKIWNKDNSDCPFVNEAVAGGAGTNAKAVLAKRLQNNDPPDSFQGHAGKELLDYIKAGQIEPIDFIYNDNGFKDAMPATLIDQISYKGKLYSVPVNIHRANILWYSPKVLKKAGIATPPKTWNEFIAALDKAKAAGVIPLALGEQWTQQHLLETVMIGALGTDGWAKLWVKGADWSGADVTIAIDRFKALLTYTNTDAASLTWQEAGKLVVTEKAAFNVMGDWQDGYFSGSLKGDNLAKKANVDYGWVAVPDTDGVFDWLSDSFTLPKGAPHRDAAVKWLGFLGSKQAQDTFNPLKGSIPARTDTDPALYDEYLQWNLKQWKTDKLACSLTHGCAASNAWTADIGTAFGLFLQDKDVAKFQKALVTAAGKYSATN
jgi:glucose/mannose transport system substrate-binding protein